jgi:hypothetical protein
MYICKYCKEEKDLNLFKNDKSRKNGHDKICNECKILFKNLQYEISFLTSEEKNQKFIELYYLDLEIKDRVFATLFKCEVIYIYELRKLLDIKKCSECKEIKSLSKFKDCSSTCNRDEKFSYCLDCYDKYHEKYRNDDEKMKIRNIYIKNWQKDNKELCQYRSIQWTKNKRNIDLHFKLISNFRNVFKNHLINQVTNFKISKEGMHTEEILGYKFEQLITHLESKFQNGMTWDNYGKWHIDHIKPISLFNINSLECNDLKECWSLENLQPLWAEDNLKKSNKY